MFPGAYDRIYRNEAGEPIGWDSPSDYESESDDWVAANDRDQPIPKDECKRLDLHGTDRDGPNCAFCMTIYEDEEDEEV